MKVKKWQRIISLILIAGVLMKLFDIEYGKLIFTIGFGGYFLLKLIKLFGTKIRYWNDLHFVQLGLILIGMAALIFLYYEYPYSRAVFATALGLEGLVAMRIQLNALFGNHNVKNFLRLIIRALFSKPGPPKETIPIN